MRFTVKYEINQYRIFDEDRKPAGVLRRSLTSGNSLEIFDASGQRIGRAVRGRGEIIVEETGNEDLHCVLEYPSDAEGHIIQEAYTRPPMPQRTVIGLPGKQIELCQTRRREFQIRTDGREIGRMTHMQSAGKKMTLPDGFPEKYCGVVFAVGFLMLHDDDIEIV